MEELSRRELLLCSLNRQYLLEKGERMQVVGDLLGLQAQFAQNPVYALRIRARDFQPETWGQGLVKIWSHRGTIHAVRQDQLGLLLSARGVERQWEEGSGPMGGLYSAADGTGDGAAGGAEAGLPPSRYGGRAAGQSVLRLGRPVERDVRPGNIGLPERRGKAFRPTWAYPMDGSAAGPAGSDGAIFQNLRPGDLGGLRRFHRLENGRNPAIGRGAAFETNPLRRRDLLLSGRSESGRPAAKMFVFSRF